MAVVRVGVIHNLTPGGAHRRLSEQIGKGGSASGDSRAHGSRGNVEDLCNLVVRQVAQVTKHNRSPELHRQYQGRVVAVHHHKVWGVGKDCDTAWEDARQKPGCPEFEEFAFVPLWGMPGNPEEIDQRAKPA